MTISRRCNHPVAQQTLCEYIHPEYGRIVMWQCDLCGADVRSRDVTWEEVERLNLPPLDEQMYHESIRRAHEQASGRAVLEAMRFMAHAAK